MPPKRKPTPSVASSNPTSPRTPVAHKQKKFNPPRLCVQNSNPFNGRMTRGRKRIQIPKDTDDSDSTQITETEPETQDEEDDAPVKPVSLQARAKSLGESFELLTLKNNNQIPALTKEIKRISIDSENSIDSRNGSVASQSSKTTKKNVTYALPRVSETDGESEESPPGPSRKTPHQQGFKTPVRLVPLPGPSKRDIAVLDTISLIEDTMANNFDCFTGVIIFRDFELTARENLVALHSEICMKMQELRRLAEMSLIGFSADFLECQLADLLQENGNPESLEDLIKIFAEKSIGSTDQISVVNDSSKASVASSKNLGGKVRKSDADDEDSICSGSTSPELFTTPKKQVLSTLPPLPPRTVKSAKKSSKAPFVFPSSTFMSSGSSDAENSGNNVFVFGAGHTSQQTGVKVPRPVRPGEIAFSKSGSPIVSAKEAILPSTPVQPATKTVRIQVDNGDGKAIDVDIVYRGNPDEEGGAKLFRAFMTDVRGVVTARTTGRGKRVLPPHVPPKKASKASAQKAGPSGTGISKKPQWL